MLASLKQLLSSIVDYAGLFPPAQLSLPEAIATCDRAQSSPHRWMLGRFVLPASRLHEFVALLPTVSLEMQGYRPWSLSVILSKNWAAELEQVHQINDVQEQIVIRALEIVPLLPSEVQQVCLNLPAETISFFEIPFNAELEPYIKVLQQTGAAAKLRTGGITRDAFPDCAQLSQRILSLANAHIPFKATAGLHHPLRGDHRLIYERDSASATMHGFLNVAILAAFAYQHSITSDEALAILTESAIAQFHFTDTEISWQSSSGVTTSVTKGVDRFLSLSEIEQCRQQFFHSFGSCSFQEPIDDLYNLGLL